MTSTVRLTRIVDSIADMDWSARGIHSATFASMPVNASAVCPVLTPQPDNPVTDVQFTRQTYGAGGSAKMDLEYTLHYLYFHAPIGAGLGLFSVYNAMMENIDYILEQIMDNDAPEGAIDMQVLNIPRIAPIKDAAGNDYHGMEIALRVKEFMETS